MTRILRLYEEVKKVFFHFVQIGWNLSHQVSHSRIEGGSKLTYKYILSFCLISLIFFAGVINQTAFSENQHAIIKAETINVRKGPGLTYPVIQQLHKNEKYKILSSKEEWIELQIKDNKTGWVANWLVEKQTQIEKVTPTVDNLRVRTGPGLNFKVIGHISKGEVFPKLTENENWFEIGYHDENAWVSANYMKVYQAQQNKFKKQDEPRSKKGKIIASILNVRSKPNLSADIIGKLKEGDIVSFVEKKADWVKVNIDHKMGWVHQDYIEEITGSVNVDPKKETNKVKGKITATTLNVRSNPSLTSDIIGKLKEGEIISLLEEKKDWYKINFQQKTGWVFSKYVNKLKNNEKKNESSEETESKIGKVNATILNVRSIPSLKGDIVSRLENGEEVKVISTQDDWTEIQLKNQEKAWVASRYLEIEGQKTQPIVTIIHNGTNIRKGPSTNTEVLKRSNKGDQFPILQKEGDWYQIKLKNGTIDYVAGWIVSVSGNIEKVNHPGIEQYFEGKTIVIDPGHGGKDRGTTGVSGTIEKHLTLKTAKLLADKLKASGAKVILTRNNDHYISLKYRVSISHYYDADAFLSIHYNSTPYSYVKGISTFYYSEETDKKLAETVHKELLNSTGLKNRRVKYGNYHVIRENKQPSILLELGFLSNKQEEWHVKTNDFQEKATYGIYRGLAKYFQE